MQDFMHNVNIHVKHEYSPCGFEANELSVHTYRMNIANLRRARGLNQTELSEMANISQPAVSRAENGDDGVTLRQFRAIAAALSVPVSELFEDERTRSENELMDLFRRLPKDRQTVWLEMAKAFAQDRP